jgi:hypothetical protein
MFEVKQKVWCVMLGAGVVRNILATGTRFPLVVEFNGKLECYTLDGKCMLNTTQVLFPHPVEITKKITKPSINWEHVRDEYKFLAQDDTGSAWLYIEEPTPDEVYWRAEAGVYVNANSYASYIPGNCDWKDSLVKRPD